MTLYKQWYITAMMREAMQASLTSGTKIKFVRMVASNDVIPEKDLPGLTNDSMGTIKTNQTSRISSTTNKRDIITVTSVFNNTGVTTEYRMNTIYLVAEYNGREFLAAIQVANSAYIVPVESSTEHAEYTIKAQLGLSNTTNIDLNMDPEALATNAGLIAFTEKYDKLVTKLESEIKELKGLDDGNVKIAGDQQVSGVKTFLEKIVGTITKAVVATKLETARKINGVPFDATKDITITADTDRPKISSKTNLNNIKKEGHYHCIDNETAETLLNNPFKSTYKSFYMNVMYQDGYARQQVWYYDDPKLSYARTYSMTKQAWTPWTLVG